VLAAAGSLAMRPRPRFFVRRIVLDVSVPDAGLGQRNPAGRRIAPGGVRGNDRARVRGDRGFLRGTGMEFQPLLPMTSSRSTAGACACVMVHGFLYGLGTGQISDLERCRRCRRNRTGLHRDLRATGDDADEDESNEQAYAELVNSYASPHRSFRGTPALRQQAYPSPQQTLH